MAFEIGRLPALRRLSLLLLMGVAGCATSPVEGPRLPATGAIGASAQADSLDGVERLIRMGQRSLAGGDPGTAIGLLEQALAQDGGNREVALLLGYAHLAAASPQDAATAFGRVLRRVPEDRDAAIGYAKAMIAIGRSDAALEHVEPLVRRNARDLEALNLSGVAHDMQGEHGRAIELYRRGLAIDPDSADLGSNLGLSLALAGRHGEAVDVLRPLAEGYFSSPRHRQNLALAHGLAGSLDEAERWSRMDLAEADVLNNLRYFQLVRGMAPGAVRSAALQPDFAQPPVRQAKMPGRLTEKPAEPPPAAVPPATGTPTVLTPSAAANAAPPPSQSLPAAVRPKAGFNSGDPAVGSVGVGVVAVGDWFVDLGVLSDENWRALRETQGDTVQGLRRLGTGGLGDQPLVIGPLDSGETAAELCRRLDEAVATCRPVHL